MRELTFIVKVDVPDELCDRGLADAAADALMLAVDEMGRGILHYPDACWPWAFGVEACDWESLPESLDIPG
jgi:hypothetical protein